MKHRIGYWEYVKQLGYTYKQYKRLSHQKRSRMESLPLLPIKFWATYNAGQDMNDPDRIPFPPNWF